MIFRKKRIEYNFLIFTLLAVVFGDTINVLTDNGSYSFPGGTYIVAFLSYVSLAFFFRIKYKYEVHIANPILVIYSIWLFYLIFSLFRGLYNASDYWEFKFLFLSSTLFTLVSIVFYTGQNLRLVQVLLNFSIEKVLLFGFLLIPITYATGSELYARIMIFIGVIMLFIPYVSKKWRILIVAVAVSAVIVNDSLRISIIKITLSFLILGLYYFKSLINTVITKIVWLLFFLIPFTLLYLGLSGTFNVFSDLSKNNEDVVTYNPNLDTYESVSADTRTFLYEEVIIDVIKNDAVLFGKSPSQGYSSAWFFGSSGDRNSSIRFGSEVNILNIFLYYGLVGVLLFFVLIATVSYLAIAKSNNRLSKMLGLLIASRFMLSFVEEFTQYDINFYFFWLIVGLVSSTQFRELTDEQVRYWLRYGEKYLKHLEKELQEA